MSPAARDATIRAAMDPRTTSRPTAQTRARRRHGARSLAIALLAFSCAAPGCRSKPKDFDNENDALRRQVDALESEVSTLRARNTELEAKFAELKDATREGLERDVLEALPKCAGVEIDRYSGPTDSDGDGKIDAIDAYIRPFDGRRRFIQVAGRLTVEATLIPGPVGAPDVQPMPLGVRILSPIELREAYRASPMGTHYAVRLPLEPGTEPPPGTIILRAELLDPASGLSHKAERIVER